jgi:hypothetical protein
MRVLFAALALAAACVLPNASAFSPVLAPGDSASAAPLHILID